MHFNNTLKNNSTTLSNRPLEGVWKCGYGCFSKYFSLEKYIKIIYFLFFKNYFLHQCIKIIKKIKNFKFFLNIFENIGLVQAINKASRSHGDI
jgi:hypothetical protein